MMSISIHAPYKRVRLLRSAVDVLALKFQSTHPTRECDSQPMSGTSARNDFNPRTLQESATPEPCTRCRWCQDFNPRTLQESATAIYSKKIAFSQYIGLKILIRNKKYPLLK